jgi:NADH:ubiquinone oxidoreductase subunit 3 (subunit A)
LLPQQQRTLSFINVALYLLLLLLLPAARAAAVAAASVLLPAADSSRSRPAAFHAGRPPSSTATLHTAAGYKAANMSQLCCASK